VAARTDRTVKLARRAGRLACPTNKKQVYFTDADTEHLRLRVARSGRHGWEWRAHGRTVSLGRFCPKGEGGLDYYATRAETDRLNKAKRAGRDVRAAAFDPKQAVTVAEMLEA
jgi:hypothetical protein